MSDEDKVSGCLVIIFIGVCLICTPIGCVGCANVSYSDGFRDGTLQKFSKKGIIWKTWEGDLALDSFRKTENGVTNLWQFSVKDDQLVNQLLSLPDGQRVRLHYDQKLTTVPWRSETTYIITKIEKR